ncbi:MAG: glycosyltransferase [Chloroflexota bacterium]
MRIGMVTACYKPVMNGVTRMVSLYKEKLEAEGHEVTVFTLGDPDPAGEEENVLRSPAIPLGDTGYYFSFRYSKEAQERLRQMDIIHCHHLFMSVEMAHRYGDCPIVYTNHTRYDLYTGAYMPLPQPAADALMRQLWPEFTDYCDVVITPSPSIRDIMRAFGVRQRIEVIPNGIDLEPFWNPARCRSRSDFGIPEQATLLIYTGRLSTEKNLKKLLGQFALAHEIVSDLHLLFVGKGPLQEKLQQRAKELNLEQSVHFAGAVPYKEVGALLALADAYVTASISEVHPLGVIEGMAAGLPVAAVSSPGIADTVQHGQTGLLTSTPEGLAAAITALIIDPPRCRQMGAAAHEASRRYDIERTVLQTMELYEELRRTRPDLRREKGHGRWLKRQAPPMLEQLAQLLRPPE